MIYEFNKTPCKLLALIDLGSPVSFIRKSIFEKFCNPLITSLKTSFLSYKALDDNVIKSLGFISSSIKLKVLPNTLTFCDFHVLNHDFTAAHILLGRDFIRNNKLFYGIDNTSEEDKNIVKLFSHVPSADIINHESKFTDSFPEINIDFDLPVKNKLISLIQEINSTSIPIIQDDYSVKVNLKDKTTYAYAPRKFVVRTKTIKRDH